MGDELGTNSQTTVWVGKTDTCDDVMTDNEKMNEVVHLLKEIREPPINFLTEVWLLCTRLSLRGRSKSGSENHPQT